MSQEDEYAAMRARFARLCAGMVVKNKAEERLARAPAELDQFCADPRVVRAGVTDDAFGFVTQRLIMRGDEGLRWAGTFAVKIETKTAAIRCRNLERESTTVQHPHVGSGVTFNPCLGTNNANVVTKLRGDGRLAHLGTFIIEFLEVYNSGSSYYQSVNTWDPLTPEEVKRWNER